MIEDEANILSFVSTVLEANDYKVLTAKTCSQGQLMFSSHIPDLVILDLGLPDCDGLEFIRSVRTESAVPIIVLSARSQESDKVAALDLGANDYITKPFGTDELTARIRAALRNNRLSAQGGGGAGGIFSVYDLVIDYNKRMVTAGGRVIRLTQTEYNIVALLSIHSGKVMTYAAIIKAIWGCPDSGSVKKLQVNMANIRKKLGVRPGENKYIINELGVGYRMCDE